MKVIITAFLTVSMLMCLVMAFFTSYPYPDLIPTGFTLRYIVQTFSSDIFLQSLFSTVLLGGCCAVLSTVFGFMLSRGIVVLGGRYKNLLVSFFTLPLFFPAISMFIGVHVIMLKISIANSFFGVLISHMLLAIPYAMNIGVSFFLGIPKELETISVLLGADDIKRVKTIILPLISGGIGLSISMTFLISVSEYFATFLIGGGNIITLAGIIYPYISNFDMQNSAILGTVFLAINLTAFSISGIWMKRRSYLY